jgi:ABC-type nitrate/sulfonate/bicarbonate transport system substrate-binding protein
MDALKAQGYTIEMTELANSTLVAAALARGDTDLASFNNQTAWDAIAKGSNIRTIVGRYVTSPLIVVKQELKTCADLDGKPVALNGTTGLTPLLFNLYLEQNCPGTKPQILTIAAAATRTAALESGAVDAAQAESQDIVELEHTVPGRFRTLVALGQAFPKVQSGGVHVRADWAKQNPGIVKDFVRALLTADRQVNDNHDLLFSQAVSRLGLDPAVAREAGTIQLGYNTWDSNGALTTDNVQYTLDFLAKSDSALAKLKIDDVADLSYLNAVLDDIGRK